jgi:hypothetical protein
MCLLRCATLRLVCVRATSNVTHGKQDNGVVHTAAGMPKAPGIILESQGVSGAASGNSHSQELQSSSEVCQLPNSMLRRDMFILH